MVSLTGNEIYSDLELANLLRFKSETAIGIFLLFTAVFGRVGF
jgi:hypothetical protein